MHVAKFLSQKKQRKTIGGVHIVNEVDGDYRKVAVILTPPVDDSDTVEKKSSKKKRKVDTEQKKKKRKKTRFNVRLVFGVQFDGARDSPDTNTGWMPSARLFPDRCNNKVAEVKGQNTTNDATPMYNNSLAADLHLLSNTDILSSVSMTALKAFSESWTLLKIWCLQRGFLRGSDTFTDMTLGLSLAYLYRSKMVSARMDSVQVFTVWMKFISDQDWLGEKEQRKKKGSEVNEDTIRYSSSIGYRDLNIRATRGKRFRGGVVMPETDMSEKETVAQCIQNRLFASDIKQKISTSDENAEIPKNLMESFKMSTDSPIFLDPSMTNNYFGNISPSFIREVQSEAKKALECIHFHRDNGSDEASARRIDPFRQLFLEQLRFYKRYDAYISFDLKDIITPNLDENNSGASFWGNDAQDRGNYTSIANGLVQVLNMALGDRVSAIRVLTTGNGDPSSKNHFDKDMSTSVIVGSDEIQMIPIRVSNDSVFSGIDLDNISSPVSGESRITLGVRINRENCYRLVDRGPPANDTKASQDFVSLWGKKKAQLRRFKDGAIVYAVVWSEDSPVISNDAVSFENDETMGSIVERIIRHIFHGHFIKQDVVSESTFKLRNLLSLVEGAKVELKGKGVLVNSSEAVHKSIIAAYEKLASFLKKSSQMEEVGLNQTRSKLGLPLSIDGVDPLSPSLRYTSTFPQTPHAFLGTTLKPEKRVAGAIANDPILIQIKFEASSKWPNDIAAMGAAKCAMFMQIAEGIEELKEKGDSSCTLFDGPINVTPNYIDLGFSGYVWRIVIRAEQELHMLQKLRDPSTEAVELLHTLIKNHVTLSQHHYTIHSVTSKHPAAGYTTRLLNRWIASHMLSGHVPHEAVELIVASVFSDPSPLEIPSTAQCGFIRCLKLLAEHDWRKNPLIVDPEGHINSDDRLEILKQFEELRGIQFEKGPALFIISPNDSQDNGLHRPSFTSHTPERVVLSRLSALAKRSHDYLIANIKSKSMTNKESWSSVFQTSPNSLKSYSVLFRIDQSLCIDKGCSSTAGSFAITKDKDMICTPYNRSMEKISAGPKDLRLKAYKNIQQTDSLVLNFQPMKYLMQQLKSQYGEYAVFFYNEYCPDIIAMLWRPSSFERQAFSAMHAEFTSPLDKNWEANALVTSNASDILRAIRGTMSDVLVDVKVLVDKSLDFENKVDEKADSSTLSKKKRKAVEEEEKSDSGSDEDSD